MQSGLGNQVGGAGLGVATPTRDLVGQSHLGKLEGVDVQQVGGGLQEDASGDGFLLLLLLGRGRGQLGGRGSGVVGDGLEPGRLLPAFSGRVRSGGCAGEELWTPQLRDYLALWLSQELYLVRRLKVH